MPTRMVKKLAGRLPAGVQRELRRISNYVRIRTETFSAGELEFDELRNWVANGDWVLDVGANVGHYTLRLSRIVGPTGRVIAFEPITETFARLAENVVFAGCANVTLVNAAASESMNVLRMTIPRFGSGLPNYYMAAISDDGEAAILGVPVDCFTLPRITLVKIDAEGHEYGVLRGMVNLIRAWRPRLIVEGASDEVLHLLSPFGYTRTQMNHSPNCVYVASGSPPS